MERKIMIALLAVLVFGFGLAVTESHAARAVRENRYTAYKVTGLIGTQVENPLGDVVGSIQDFVIDSNGHVEFVILSHDFYWEYVPRPSQTVVVPFSEMTVGPNKKISVLKFSAWRLDFAPIFEKSEISHRRWAESAYRYFGLQLYWTEGEHKASMDPYRWGGEVQNF